VGDRRSKAARAAPGKAPVSYEALTAIIHTTFEDLSPSYQRIAQHLTQNPNDVAFQSMNGIARACRVHASSLVRFAQLLGFTGFRQLQTVFQDRLATAAPGFGARVEALRSDLEIHSHDGNRGYLRDLVARDIASLENLLAETSERDLKRAVQVLAKARTIYLAGQLRSAPVVSFLRYVLTMLRKPTVLLDANGGLATEMAGMMGRPDALIAVSFRYYAKEVVRICDQAAARDIPIIAISDGPLSPLARTAEVLFPVPEDEYSFSRSLAAPMCLAQALMIALAAKLEPGSSEVPRIPVATDSLQPQRRTRRSKAGG